MLDFIKLQFSTEQMQDRPRVKIHLTSIDLTCEILGWILVLGMWLLTLNKYGTLPDRIPIHYNILGEADGFGKKSAIITLPLISTILFIVLTILNKFPHIFNYPTTITEKDALKQYTNATRMLRCFKLVIVFTFGLISFKTIQISEDNSAKLGIWMLPLILCLIIIPMIYFTIKSNRIKKSTEDIPDN